MLRRIVVVVALAGGLVPALTATSQAAPTGGCPNPPNRPVLTFVAGHPTIVSGGSTSVYGRLTQNNCGIRGASIVVRQRALVGGKPSGTWSRVTTVTTTSKGAWIAAIRPARNQQVQAVFWKAGSFATTYSKIVPVYVRTMLTIAKTNFTNCRVLLSGQTAPVKANRPVFVQSRGPSGQFKGWTDMFQTRTNTKGRYSVLLPLTCGSTYNLAVQMDKDATNLLGRSRTIFGIKPTH